MKHKKVFISHRSYDYGKALQLENALISNGIASKVVLLKNETLCKNYEQLTVREYYEAVMDIMSKMEGCDAFYYISNANYRNGYFTNAEIILWQLNNKNPIIHGVNETPEGFTVSSPLQLPLISSSQSKRMHFAKNSMTFNVEYGTTFEPWGKFADCFLVGCCNCGKYYLISPKAMDYYIKTNAEAICPNCGHPHAKFWQDTNSRKYFSNRYPIIMSPIVENIAELESLSVDQVLDLLNANKLENLFKIVTFHDEKLKSYFRRDMERFGKVSLAIAGVIGAFLVVLSGGKSND